MPANKSNHWEYNKNLQQFANDLRHRMTRTEVYLWKDVLRASKMKGYGFRRQRPVISYIIDFMCKELNLIIEVDGASHDNPTQAARDIVRQKNLEAAGFVVIRFSDHEVIHKIEFVIAKIQKVVEAIE